MPHHPTLITAAATSEVGPLIRRLGLRRDRTLLRRRVIYTGEHGRQPIVLAITGMGPRQAAHVTEVLFRRCGPGRVLVSGTAGATNPELRTGDVIVPARILDADAEATWAPTWAAPTRYVLRTGGAVIESPTDKAALHDEAGVDAVDMETAAIARVCDHYHTPWLCARAICDTSTMILPPGTRKLVDRYGRPRLLGAAWYVLTHPHRTGALMRLGRASGRAAEALAQHIPALLNT